MDKRQIKIVAVSSFIISAALFLCAALFYKTSQSVALIYSLLIAVAFLAMGLFTLKGDKIIKKVSEIDSNQKKG
jgi:VIT1/CCC1 family predicted Fe2+/Mn2+ transporter